MITCTRKLQFCAGHRVLGHEGKCANPHGHNYTALFTAESPLDNLGRVVDFSVLKEKVGGWIEDHLDHRMLCYAYDADLIKACQDFNWPFHVMPWNPTAENISKYFLLNICPKIFEGYTLKITRVVIWETENCFAEASL